MTQILKIEQLVYGGSGLARTSDGKVVLIPFVLPQETVKVAEILAKRNVYIAQPLKIIEPNGERVNAPCQFYGECGGCHYQHIAYSHQLSLKRSIVQEQLQRLGGFENIHVREVIGSLQQYYYRNHVQFHLANSGQVGFQKASSHDVVPVDKCLLLEEPLNALVNSFSFDPGAGLERVALRHDGQGDPLLLMTGNHLNPPEFEVDFPINVVYRGPVGDMVLSGESFNIYEILGKTFQVSAGSFFQINRGVAAKIVEHLINELDLNGNPFILDLYCGVGFFSAFLAEKARKLIGIESSESSCNDFSVNLDSFDNIELYQANVENVLPSLNIHPDIAIIDPPRAGMLPNAMKSLLKCNSSQIAYISCDPSTLARDLKQFTDAGYEIKSVTPFDMFPQTYHIEVVAILKKNC